VVWHCPVAVVVAVCCRLSSSAKVLSGWGCCRQLIVRHRFEEPLLIVRHRFEEPLLVTRVPGKLDTKQAFTQWGDRGPVSRVWNCVK
jgi:hypothetical protein